MANEIVKYGNRLNTIPLGRLNSTIEELFKDWHGKYQMPDDLKDWQNAKPEGEAQNIPMKEHC